MVLLSTIEREPARVIVYQAGHLRSVRCNGPALKLEMPRAVEGKRRFIAVEGIAGEPAPYGKLPKVQARVCRAESKRYSGGALMVDVGVFLPGGPHRSYIMNSDEFVQHLDRAHFYKGGFCNALVGNAERNGLPPSTA